ncbi:MAG: acetate kinase [Elusimicrobia bacterium]|nr:acetate kinase [Elusimicrobiota bacterium]
MSRDATRRKVNLILNCGSSSVKYKVFVSGAETCLARGVVEKVGSPQAIVRHCDRAGEKDREVADIKNHKQAIQTVLSFLISGGQAIIQEKSQIKAVGHRVVHGGKYSQPVVITKEVKKYLQDVTFELAPLHNPYNFEGIEAVEQVLPGVPNVAVFDTAFHQTLPDYAYMYGIPYRFFKKHLIRKYGFHGTSHQFVSSVASRLLKKRISELKIITVHLGNGSSLAAIKNGKCVDTSMGFTPLEGVMMGTRSGDIDPAAVLHLMMAEELGIHETDTILNKQSGLLGVSGTSNDMREILKSMKSGDARAALAFNMFCYRVKKYIGSYLAVLNGADAIVFTAGIGENSAKTREEILKNAENLGIIIDVRKNRTVKPEKPALISGKNSKVAVFVIPTNEELMISKIMDKINLRHR